VKNQLRLLELGCAAVAFLGAPAPAMAQTERPAPVADKFERITASITFNHARFAQWPEDVGGDGSVTLCVFDSTASDVWTGFDGEDIGGRTLRVRLYSNEARPAPGCDMAFQSAEARRFTSPKTLSDSGAVTISASPNFLSRGGAIQLFVDDGSFHFDVNDAALKKAGVKISSKLLRVGMKVKVAQ
jgi:hypothetical protein